jgi:structural protein KPP10_ORF10
MSSYSFTDVVMSLSGPTGSLDLGYGNAVAEEGIDVDMLEDKNTVTTGADGEIMHSMHAGNTGRMTLRLLKTSPQNAKLMVMYNAQKTATALWGKNLILVRQTAAGDTHTGRQMAFQKKASVGYKKVGAFLEWPFVGVVESVLGIY